MRKLVITGANEHNLQNVSCEIPRDRLVVITGPSGSGKSSLAFDTIYAEGQRRYVESLSVYARQFLQQLPKPDVESIEGLSPAIALGQQSLGKNPRSTVGTVTEIADYLRLLFARVGSPHCPVSGAPLRAYSVQEIVDAIIAQGDGRRLLVLAPIVRSSASDLKHELARLRREGFVRVKLDDQVVELSEPSQVDPSQPHDLSVVVDRLVVRSDARNRITDSVELALRLGDGTLLLDAMDGSAPRVMSERLVSWEHDIVLPPLEPRLFSFNSPQGACPSCSGLGHTDEVDPLAVITDPDKSLRQGAIAALGRRGSVARSSVVAQLVKALGVDPDKPWHDLDEGVRHQVLFGSNDQRKARHWPGVVAMLKHLTDELDEDVDDSGHDDGALSPEEGRMFLRSTVCDACKGRRLRPAALAVTFDGKNFGELSALELGDLRSWLTRRLEDPPLGPNERQIARPLLRALTERLTFLTQVGLGSLSLDRSTNTLSSGEGQRIRLATQLGAALVGVLYVLDEPSVGLHPRDTAQLLAALRQLVDKGNTVLLVEHDRDAILAADHVLDLGPGAGAEGGRIVARGTPAELMRDPSSVTGPFLEPATAPQSRRRVPPGDAWVGVLGATAHNLQNIDVHFPVGLITAVTGVSGSGKSSLVIDVLLAAARARLHHASTPVGSCREQCGLEHFDEVVSITRAPIGRTPRSNPATYTGIFGLLRELYAALPEARSRGYKPGRFSFNKKGGRCEKCRGGGVLRVELSFLPDLYVECDVCQGKRYNRETLELEYKGLNIADALACSVDQARDVFANVPKLAQRLDGLRHIGLGYIQLGQAATTLSGGEAQRLKLASELWKRGAGRTLYVLDEPTTGLHFRDIQVLSIALAELRDAGNTVVLIEHDMDLVADADWVIDLGPGGGADGGRIVAYGTPEAICQNPSSRTAEYLRAVL